MALLFGAHCAAGSVKTTTVMRGDPIPMDLPYAADQLVDAVEADDRD